MRLRDSARIASASSVLLTTTWRRSSGCGSRRTRPFSSSIATILVIEGGCTCSFRASSPGVALPHRARVPSTPISVGLSDSSTRW